MNFLTGADVPPDPNSGAAGTVWQINQALRSLGHEVDEIWEQDLSRKIHHGNLHYLLELPRRYRFAVRQRLSTKRYDVIILSQPHAYLAALDHKRVKRSGIFLIRSHGIEQRVSEVLATHKVQISNKSLIRTAASYMMERLLCRHAILAGNAADGLLVPCSEDKGFLVSRFKVAANKVGMIPYASPDEYIRNPQRNWSHERLRRILYVGQFAPVKGPNILAHAVNQVLTKCEGATMTWVCSKEHHPQAQALLDPSISNRVQFLGWKPQQVLMQIYDKHGTFVFPSYFESFGKACLEAMSRGLCVIASNTGGMRDYIQDGYSGHLVEVGNADLFASVLRRSISDYEGSARLGAQARACALHYSWKLSAIRTIEFCRNILYNK